MESVRGFNELKKIKGHASVSASRVNPSIRFEVSFGMKANPSNRSLSWAKFMDVVLRLSSFRFDFNAFQLRSMMNNVFRL